MFRAEGLNTRKDFLLYEKNYEIKIFGKISKKTNKVEINQTKSGPQNF